MSMNPTCHCEDCADGHELYERPLAEDGVTTVCPGCGCRSFTIAE